MIQLIIGDEPYCVNWYKNELKSKIELQDFNCGVFREFSGQVTAFIGSYPLMEDKKLLDCVITQNIDGFHTDAGSKNVYELHGSIKRNYCMDCHKFYDDTYIFNSTDIPKCSCGGIIKPDVVLYEEGLDDDTIKNSIRAIASCDLLIIGGTSLNVYPAAGFINYFRGKHLVLINRDSTNYDSMCDLVIHENIGKVFEQIKKEI